MLDLLISPFTRIWYVIIAIFIGCLFSILYIGSQVSDKWKYRILRFMGFYLLIDFIVYEGYMLYHELFSLRTCLPLAFCSMMQLMAGYAGSRKSHFAFEFCLLLGIVGPFQAYISPVVVCRGQEYLLIEYFIAHGITIIIPLFMAICIGYEPRKYSVLRSIVLMQVIVVLVYFINVYLGANYMYLIKKPPINHPLNLGNWPYYLMKWHLLFYSSSIFIYSIFRLRSYIGRKTTDKL